MGIDELRLGYAIKVARQRLRMTQKELAQRAGVTSNYLSLLENGKRGVSIEQLNTLADALGIPTTILTVLAENGSGLSDCNAAKLLRQIQSLAGEAMALWSVADKR